MTILVFGGNGQVGQELLRALAPLGKVVQRYGDPEVQNGSVSYNAEFPAEDCVEQKTSTGHSFVGPLMAGDKVQMAT